MMRVRLVLIAMAALLTSQISGCCGTSGNVRVIDLVQDKTSKNYDNCGEGRSPYVWPDQRIAVCWPLQVTAYVACVEHLALASRTSEETRKASLDASAKFVDKLDGNAKLAIEDVTKWIEKMVTDGEIGKARAQAIITCSRLIDVKEAAAVKAFLGQ